MILGELAGHRVIAPQQLPLSRDTFVDIAGNGLLGIQPGLLREVADREPLGGKRLAFELGDLTGHDPENGALAGAVQTQDADLCPWKKRQPDIAQHLPVGWIDLGQALHRVDVLRSPYALSYPVTRIMWRVSMPDPAVLPDPPEPEPAPPTPSPTTTSVEASVGQLAG